VTSGAIDLPLQYFDIVDWATGRGGGTQPVKSLDLTTETMETL